MTTPNDRWEQRAREIGDKYPGYHPSSNQTERLTAEILQALHSAEKEGVRRGLLRAAVVAEEYTAWSPAQSDEVAKAIREEANKEM